jgi:hypothetical protein
MWRLPSSASQSVADSWPYVTAGVVEASAGASKRDLACGLARGVARAGRGFRTGDSPVFTVGVAGGLAGAAVAVAPRSARTQIARIGELYAIARVPGTASTAAVST